MKWNLRIVHPLILTSLQRAGGTVSESGSKGGRNANSVNAYKGNAKLIDYRATKTAVDVAKLGCQVPMKCAGQPSEIAPPYVFLASSGAFYITG